MPLATRPRTESRFSAQKPTSRSCCIALAERNTAMLRNSRLLEEARVPVATTPTRGLSSTRKELGSTSLGALCGSMKATCPTTIGTAKRFNYGRDYPWFDVSLSYQRVWVRIVISIQP